MDVKFSIIIPTYNRAHTIAQAINSILGQVYANFEIIVVDDGSIDNTKEVIEKISAPNLLYFKKENGERGAARNYGTQKATGDYITFLDSDDLFYSNHLTEAYKVINEMNSPEVFRLGFEIKDSKGTTNAVYSNYKSPVNAELIKGNILGCCGVFLRNDIALSNLFNEDRILSACEDWELWLRIASKYPIHAINLVTASMINHEGRSVLDADYRKLIARFDAFLKYVLNDKGITDYYKGKIVVLKSSCYTYVALHIALTGKHKFVALKYLYKGIAEYPGGIFSRRFLAVMKHILM